MTYLQAVVPLRDRRLVLKHCHDIRASGHLGVTKTLNRIWQRSYWPGMKNCVRSYIEVYVFFPVKKVGYSSKLTKQVLFKINIILEGSFQCVRKTRRIVVEVIRFRSYNVIE